MRPLKSLVILAAVVLSAVAHSSQAAPGAFTLTATATCDAINFAPAILLQWTPSSGATSYAYIRDDGQTYTVSGQTLTVHDWAVVAGGPTHTYFVRASDGGPVTTDSNTGSAAPVAVCAPPPEPFTISGRALCDPGDPTRSMSPSEDLNWKAALFATSYEIWRNGTLFTTMQAQHSSSFELTARVANGSTGTHYFVVARNSVGTSTSNTVEITVPADICIKEPPVAVLSGNATCDPQTHQPQVSLSWPIVPGLDGWKLYRDGSVYAVPQGSSYSDKNVVSGHTYTYNIATNGLSAPLSNAVTITIPESLCEQSGPPGVFTLMASAGCSPVVLTWTAPANNVLSYSIFRNQVLTTTLGSSARTYSEEGLASVSFSYFVRATGLGGVSDSNLVTVDRTLCDVPVPDLAALDIKPSAMSGRAGDTIAVNVELANVGNAMAMASTARIRFGRGPSMSSSDPVLATIALPAIDFGADIHRTMDVKLPAAAAGTYYLFFSLDEEHFSGEANTGDNVKASAAFTLGEMIPPKRRAATH